MPNKLPEIRETQISQLIQNYLQAEGYYVQRLNAGGYKTNTGYLRGVATGTPDIMAFKKCGMRTILGSGHTHLLFVEVKRPSNPKPTFNQEMKMKELEEHGARCLVVHSLEELQNKLEGGEESE